MISNILTSGGWIKKVDLNTVNSKKEKVRIYEKPAADLQKAEEAIRQTITVKNWTYEDNLKTLGSDIQKQVLLD